MANQGENVITTITREELKPFLSDPRALGTLREPYFTIKGEDAGEITILSPGKNGTEFNKTIGYFHKVAGVITYHITFGQGVILMQRNDPDDEAKEVRVLSIRAGSVIDVPAGFGHCLVNVGKTFLVAIATGVPNNKLLSTEGLKVKKGFAYYLVDKKGDVGFDANPNYRIHPQISTG